MNTISSIVIENNPNCLATAYSSIWNAHKSGFGKTSKAYKDAVALAEKVSKTNTIDFEVYAVVTKFGRSAHSKSDVMLLALPARAGVAGVDCVNRIVVRLFTAVTK